MEGDGLEVKTTLEVDSRNNVPVEQVNKTTR